MDLSSLASEINQVNDNIAKHPDELADTDDEHISETEEEEEESVKSDEESDEEEDEGEEVQLDDGSDSEGLRLDEDEQSESVCDSESASAFAACASNAPTSQAKKRARDNADEKALREIRRIQAKTDFLIPFAPFNRLVREIASDFKTDLRFTKNAILALQTESESHIIGLLTSAQVMALHGGRVGIMPKDLQMAQRGHEGV
jgi:histone H3